ncbi:MAG: hypothetical protein PHD15_07410 [Clostridia bacterium]|nr:hypothetical protein [Clostridia bacterium]MDD4387558.1 hypothetical protein [Clostridia bacterium]
MFQIIFLLVILFIFSLFFIKVKIEITIDEEMYIDISVLKYIKLKRFKFNKNELKEIESKSQKVAKEEVENYLKNIEFTDAKLFFKSIKELFGKVKIEKLDFRFNINVDDYILNSYIVTFINSAVAIIISKNIEKINTEKLSYVITSNEKEIKLNLKCIMYGKFANIILVLRKIVYYAFKLKKRGNEKHGKRTSNRKSNGNSNDVVRVNG